MKIRGYQKSDDRATYQLFYDTVHQINQLDYSPEQLAVWAPGRTDLSEWGQSLAKKYTLVAINNGEIVGFADLATSGYLDRLYVHHKYQRQGIAQALLNALEQYAKNQGISRITVAVSLTAKPFFLKNDYQIIREQQVQREGINLSNFLMAKQL